MIDELDREIHNALAALLDLAPEPHTEVVAAEHERRRPVAVAASLVVVAAVGLTGWLVARPQPSSPTLTVTPTTSAVTIAPTATEPASSTSSPVDSTVLADLPVSPSELVAQTPEQTSTLSHGIGMAIKTCMAEAGFDYHLQKVILFPPVPRALDETWRRQYGYGFPRTDTSDPAWDAWITTAQKDPAFMRALGPDARAPGGGCTPRAYRQIYPPDGSAVSSQNATFNKELAAFIVRTYGPVDQRLAKVLDPEMETARVAWATCMKTVGVDAVYPGQLKSKLLIARPSQRDDEGVTQAEIDVALQDWQCEVSTGFLQHWYGRLQQLTAEFARDHADLIAQIRQWNTDATARAQQAIDAGS